MLGVENSACDDLSAAFSLEEQLVVRLNKTSEEVARMESLDTEQRAEVYAILEALHADTKVHREMVEMLKNTPLKKATHA